MNFSGRFCGWRSFRRLNTLFDRRGQRISCSIPTVLDSRHHCQAFDLKFVNERWNLNGLEKGSEGMIKKHLANDASWNEGNDDLPQSSSTSIRSLSRHMQSKNPIVTLLRVECHSPAVSANVWTSIRVSAAHYFSKWMHESCTLCFVNVVLPELESSRGETMSIHIRNSAQMSTSQGTFHVKIVCMDLCERHVMELVNWLLFYHVTC